MGLGVEKENYGVLVKFYTKNKYIWPRNKSVYVI